MKIDFKLDSDIRCELCCSEDSFLLTHKEKEGLAVFLCNGCILEISKWQQQRENQCRCNRCCPENEYSIDDFEDV